MQGSTVARSSRKFCECSNDIKEEIKNDHRYVFQNHTPRCPKYETEKIPRLFYYEDAARAFIPAPSDTESFISLDSFLGEGDAIEIKFKRFDMTQESFDNLVKA